MNNDDISEEEEDRLHEYLRTKEFQDKYMERIKADTWEKGLPMVYSNNLNQIVKHYPDGKIEIVKQM